MKIEGRNSTPLRALKCVRIHWITAAYSIALFALLGTIQAQVDPGPRAGKAGAGGPYPTLSADDVAFFNQALERFKEIDSVSGTIGGETGSGLGPTFNGNSCSSCHSQPSVGGTSPSPSSHQNPAPNPQVAVAKLDGATNTVPSFITADGPVREVRFKSDSGVHGLFTIAGRSDARGCILAQPDFAQQMAANNVSFRIPTPVFGLGLVEDTPDAALRANLAAFQSAKHLLGIGGSFNLSGNDGTITRFGWKAQNKSLLIFAGEAYNVEIGVSNELFPNERSATPGCEYDAGPKDSTNILNPINNSNTGTASEMSSDIVNFAAFMRLTAPAAPAPPTSSTQSGQAMFNSIGCVLCHSASLTTTSSIFKGLGYESYHPFSDFALHHMGTGLADGVTQGSAGGHLKKRKFTYAKERSEFP
jgi:CxxC motif-containing protein (DUF1111 family)